MTEDEPPLSPQAVRALFEEWWCDYARAAARDNRLATGPASEQGQALPQTITPEERAGGIVR